MTELAATDDRQQRILVVDDDEAYRAVVARWLEAGGYEVVGAQNGLEAVRLASELTLDLILLDLVLPGLNGFECMKTFRQLSRVRDVPVIVVTGLREPSNLGEAKALGARDVMLKPLDEDELRVKVHLALDSHAARPPRPS